MPTANFEAKEQIPSNEINMTLNANMLQGMQASESYNVAAVGGSVLGAGGETRAFGKYNFDPNTASPAVAINIANSSGPLFNNANMVNDENIGGDRNLLTRAVATSQLDQHLGLGILAEEKFGMKDGRMVGISVQVDGVGMTGKYDTMVNGQQEETHAFLGISPQDSGTAISNGLMNDASISDNLKGYANPGIQKGLSDLEVMDYISGQIDRHPGNIFIDPANGKVKGIDNDLAFPEKGRAQVLASDVALRQKMAQGLPSVIHQDTADKLMKADPESVRRMLQQVQRPDGQPGLSAEEINGAVERLQELQNAIKNPGSVPGFQVVAQFDETTFRQAVERQNQAFQQQHGNGVANASFNQINLANRTSYLGAAVLAEKQKSMEMAQQPNGNAIRPGNTAGQAARNPEYVEYAKMLEVAKQDFKAKPQNIADPQTRQQVVDLKQQIAEAKEKVSHYERETAKLEAGGLGAKFRSLASGGVEGRKDFYADKKIAAEQRISDLERQLDRVAAEAVPVALKQGMMQDAQQIVQANAANNVMQAPNYPAPNPPGQNGLPPAPNYPAPNPPGQNGLPPPPNYPAPNPPGQNGLPPPPNYPAPNPPGQNGLPPPPNYPAPNPPGQNGLPPPPNYPAPNPPGQNGLPPPPNYPAPNPPGQINNPAPPIAQDGGGQVEVKKEGVSAAKPKVSEALKRSNSAPNLNTQGLDAGDDKKAGDDKSLRASGAWQSAKPKNPSPPAGGASLRSSKP